MRTNDAIVRLEDVAVARNLQAVRLVRDDHDGVQAAQELVHAPRLGELHASARQLPLVTRHTAAASAPLLRAAWASRARHTRRVLLQLRLEPLEKRERVCRGACGTE